MRKLSDIDDISQRFGSPFCGDLQGLINATKARDRMHAILDLSWIAAIFGFLFQSGGVNVKSTLRIREKNWVLHYDNLGLNEYVTE
jgi:hypothetical protein